VDASKCRERVVGNDCRQLREVHASFARTSDKREDTSLPEPGSGISNVLAIRMYKLIQSDWRGQARQQSSGVGVEADVVSRRR
jgi:hypothetical protein